MGLAPVRLTVTLAVTEPGLSTWMLSPTIPADALSYQLRYEAVAACEGVIAQTSLKLW